MQRPSRFNRYIVECKDRRRSSTCPIRFADLIDTLWNVKLDETALTEWLTVDLIDTLWNVKNAAIQERVYERVLDLIDTLWNVKSHVLFDKVKVSMDLIDTLWNVKWHMDESRKRLLIKR